LTHKIAQNTSEKRAAGQKAESEFFAMLKENISQVQGLSWKEVGFSDF
jgi:hypothetical protein